jgi:hypothetical protein
MNIEYTREVAQKFGLKAAVQDLVYRAANRLVDVKLLDGIVLTTATLDTSYLEGPADKSWGFLDRETLITCVEAQEADMTAEFVEDALGRGDQCFGRMDGKTLASYGWYSRRPTLVENGLMLHFDPAYSYMYKGFTMPAYRGQRLHGIGMALSLVALAGPGQKGLVSFVHSNNFPSLKSCYRMGYRDFGQLVAAKIRGHRFTYATPGCKPYDFRLEVVAEAPTSGTTRPC